LRFLPATVFDPSPVLFSSWSRTDGLLGARPPRRKIRPTKRVSAPISSWSRLPRRPSLRNDAAHNGPAGIPKGGPAAPAWAAHGDRPRPGRAGSAGRRAHPSAGGGRFGHRHL